MSAKPTFEELIEYHYVLKSMELDDFVSDQLKELEIHLNIYHGSRWDDFLENGYPFLANKSKTYKNKFPIQKLKKSIAMYKYRHYNKYDKKRQAKFDRLEVSDNTHMYESIPFNAHFEAGDIPVPSENIPVENATNSYSVSDYNQS